MVSLILWLHCALCELEVILNRGQIRVFLNALLLLRWREGLGRSWVSQI
jgi:hypothetical protein